MKKPDAFYSFSDVKLVDRITGEVSDMPSVVGTIPSMPEAEIKAYSKEEFLQIYLGFFDHCHIDA